MTNPPGLHPSEPNYLWLEAGTNFGIHDDNPPLLNHQSTTSHLVTSLSAAGLSWKSYQEDISGTVCPLGGENRYIQEILGVTPLLGDAATATNLSDLFTTFP